MRKFIMRSIRFIKGFTLVEVLVSFGVIAVVAGISISTFSSYNKSQIFTQGVNDFKDLLGVSRSRAISQVKPPSCGATPLEGYEVRITVSGVGYSQYVKCGGVYYLISQRRLPQQLSFISGSATSILFNVSTGTVTTPGSIIIAGLDKSNTVLIEKTGKISVSITGSLVAGPTPEVTVSSAPSNVCTAQNAAYWNHPIAGCVYVGPGYSAASHCNSTCTWAIGSQEPVAGPTTPPGAPTATSGACTRDYYYSPPYCTYVGGNRGTHCDSSCGGATVPTATSAPAAATTAPTSGPAATSAPVATATPGSCAKDYYYYAPYSYCTFVGGNNGTHCDAACTRTN